MKPSIPFKAACGYFLITVMFIAGIYIVYSQTYSILRLSENEESISSRRKATNLLIYKLFKVENMAHAVQAGNSGAYAVYEQSLSDAHDAILFVDSLLTDSLNKNRLDTLSYLLDQRKNNLRKLVRTINSTTPGTTYKRHIDSLLSLKDTIVSRPQLKREIIQSEESYTIQKPKKRFIQRLAEAFNPQTADTTQVSRSTRIVSVDTLKQDYNTADSLAFLLTGIEEELKLARHQHRQQVETQSRIIGYEGLEISNRLAQLLESIEHDEQLWIQAETEKAIQSRNKAMLTTSGVATAAIMLAVLFFILIKRDHNKSNHYRNELEKAKRKAESLLVSREKLMLTITHDIKAPAGTISGYADLLAETVSDKKEQLYIHNIKEAVKHLLSLVNSLLDFHRLEAEKMDSHSVSFFPKQLMNDIYESFIPAANQKGIGFTLEYETTGDLNCRGDAFHIRQIIENLVSNAIKFTQSGKVSLRCKQSENNLTFIITDTGCGMNEEETAQIFQAFTRLRSAQGEEGVGLGLSITRKLVSLLNGKLSVQSVPDRGTTFTISIPVETSPNVATTLENTPSGKLPPLHILLVDDDTLQLKLAKTMLEQIQPDENNGTMFIKTCSRPEYVSTILENESFDLLFTDIQMPGMNGFSLSKSLSEKGLSNMPVIAVTARQDIEEKEFIAQGFATCLYKPYSRKELYTAIQKAIKGRNESTIHTQQQTSENLEEPGNLRFQELTAFANGDPSAANDILTTYLEETISHEKSFATALKKKDHNTLCNLAHKLLPTSILINAPSVQALKLLDSSRETLPEWTARHQQAAETILATLRQIISALQKDTGYKNL